MQIMMCAVEIAGGFAPDSYRPEDYQKIAETPHQSSAVSENRNNGCMLKYSPANVPLGLGGQVSTD
jgi:hypothetical protein